MKSNHVCASVTNLAGLVNKSQLYRYPYTRRTNLMEIKWDHIKRYGTHLVEQLLAEPYLDKLTFIFHFRQIFIWKLCTQNIILQHWWWVYKVEWNDRKFVIKSRSNSRKLLKILLVVRSRYARSCYEATALWWCATGYARRVAAAASARLPQRAARLALYGLAAGKVWTAP